jgi:hypothetical protein
MPFNGSGVFQRVRNWVADATAGIKIRADYHDAEDDGFAAGLTNCIAKDGQTTITQNIPFNSKRITGLADPVNAQDASTKAYADTKMPLAGGTFTGPITVAGTVTATGYGTRKGLAGPAGANWFNFDWNGGNVEAWIDNTNVGALATQGYVNGQVATLQATDTSLQNQINTKQASLGFTPVQQGGGLYQQANKIYIGWDGTTLRAQVDSSDIGRIYTENFHPSSITSLRLAYAGDVAIATGPQSSIYEPYTGAVITGWMWGIIGGIAEATAFRMRYVQIYTDNWYTVGYA